MSEIKWHKVLCICLDMGTCHKSYGGEVEGRYLIFPRCPAGHLHHRVRLHLNIPHLSCCCIRQTLEWWDPSNNRNKQWITDSLPVLECLPTNLTDNVLDQTPESLVPIASNGEVFPWDDVRLPIFLSPIVYDLYLRPNLTTLGVYGIIRMEFKVGRRMIFFWQITYSVTEIEWLTRVGTPLSSSQTTKNIFTSSFVFAGDWGDWFHSLSHGRNEHHQQKN